MPRGTWPARPAELANLIGAALLYYGFFGGGAVLGLWGAIGSIRNSNTVEALFAILLFLGCCYMVFGGLRGLWRMWRYSRSGGASGQSASGSGERSA
jgi:hypothetical protein